MTEQEILLRIDEITDRLNYLSEYWSAERNLPFPIFWERVALHQERMRLRNEIFGG